MKKAQLFTMDFVIAIVMMFMIIVFFFSILLMLNEKTSVVKIESSILFEKLKKNINTFNFSGSNINNSEINFFMTNNLNITKYENFGNISFVNQSLYKDYFNKNTNFAYYFDVCMFIHTSNYSFVNFTGPVAYGLVYNDSSKNTFMNCSEMVENNQNPCHFYQNSKVISTPITINQSYYSMYFVYCYR